MSHPKPFHRNVRGFIDRTNSGYSQWAYIVDRAYAKNPEHYIRAFLLIQSDLQRLFEFVEPSDTNLAAFSYRTHELFMRTCIELEANFKAILKENIFNPTKRDGSARPEKDWNINDYKKVNTTHHLSSYKVFIPIWDGAKSCFEPFKQWANAAELTWYQAYNASKHDRQNEFRKANFENLLNSVAGLLILLSSQFETQDFSPGSTTLAVKTDSYYSTSPALGGFFHIEFPSDWQDSEKYDFDWNASKAHADRFQKIDYNLI
jgi:hypothetical protein